MWGPSRLDTFRLVCRHGLTGDQMLTVPQLLDFARAHGPVQSDYRLARVLGVGDTSVYNYRHGGRVPADDIAVKLAELAKLSAPWVLVCMSAQRASDPSVRAAFETAARALAPADWPTGGDKMSEAPTPQNPDEHGARASSRGTLSNTHCRKYVAPTAAAALTGLALVVARRDRLRRARFSAQQAPA